MGYWGTAIHPVQRPSADATCMHFLCCPQSTVQPGLGDRGQNRRHHPGEKVVVFNRRIIYTSYVRLLPAMSCCARAPQSACAFTQFTVYTAVRDRYGWVYTTFSYANSNSEGYLVQVKVRPCVRACVGVHATAAFCSAHIYIPYRYGYLVCQYID